CRPRGGWQGCARDWRATACRWSSSMTTSPTGWRTSTSWSPSAASLTCWARPWWKHCSRDRPTTTSSSRSTRRSTTRRWKCCCRSWTSGACCWRGSPPTSACWPARSMRGCGSLTWSWSVMARPRRPRPAIAMPWPCCATWGSGSKPARAFVPDYGRLTTAAWLRRLDQRQAHDEFRALPLRAAAESADLATVAVDHLVDQAQADAQPAMRARGVVLFALGEQLEHMAQLVPGNSGAVVGHHELRVTARASQHELQLATVGRELRGVLQQVAEHLHQAHAVAGHPQRLVGDLLAQGVAVRVDLWCHCLDGSRGHILQPDRRAFQADLAADDPPDVQQVVDQSLQVSHLPLQHVVDTLDARVVRCLQFHHRHDVGHRRQRVAQLMA